MLIIQIKFCLDKKTDSKDKSRERLKKKIYLEECAEIVEPNPNHPAAWEPSSPRNSEKGNNLHKGSDWQKIKLLCEETLPSRHRTAMG